MKKQGIPHHISGFLNAVRCYISGNGNKAFCVKDCGHPILSPSPARPLRVIVKDNLLAVWHA
jgi:hypothetical protein